MLKSPSITLFLCLDNTSVRYSIVASMNMELIIPSQGEDGILQLYILVGFCRLLSMSQPLEPDSRDGLGQDLHTRASPPPPLPTLEKVWQLRGSLLRSEACIQWASSCMSDSQVSVITNASMFPFIISFSTCCSQFLSDLTLTVAMFRFEV